MKMPVTLVVDLCLALYEGALELNESDEMDAQNVYDLLHEILKAHPEEAVGDLFADELDRVQEGYYHV